jgi:intracellular sulfur oxidation DsrE/DsrF family protein
MRGLWITAALVSLLGGSCVTSRRGDEPTATATHRVIFELTSDNAEAWRGVLNNVENVKTALGATSIEVVAHGEGLALLTVSSNAGVYDRLKQSADDGVVFAACENTMKRQNLRKNDLVPFATTVDSGVAEVVRKQEAGWSYLRSGL